MKKLLLIAAFALSATASLFAQAGDTLRGDITASRTLTADKYWYLDGFVFVNSGATLTVEPGTIIKGIKESVGTLIIMRGGKLVASGTADQPIIFTSAQPAGSRRAQDWGGVVILGRSSTNTQGDAASGLTDGEAIVEGGIVPAAKATYGGGTSPILDDSSGVLRYVRIEFGGVPLSTQPNSEINGLTLGAVGSRTVIDHVQVSYSGDDAIEWFGGTVKATHLVTFFTLDDDFDTDLGFRGNVQYGLVFRSPVISDISTSNGFESDTDFNGSQNPPLNTGNFSNITMLGPVGRPGVTLPPSHRFGRALYLKNNSRMGVFNSIITGYPEGFRIDGDQIASAIKNNSTPPVFKNNVIASVTKTYNVTGLTNETYPAESLETWASGQSSRTEASLATLALASPYAATGLDARPTASSPDYVKTGASFADSRLAGFEQVSYIGAFSETDNWLAGWTEFSPETQAYGGPVAVAQPLLNSATLAIYPNPAAATATLKGLAHADTPVAVQLYSLQGQLMWQGTAAATAGDVFAVELPAETLAPGVYVCTVAAGAQRQSLRYAVAR